MSDGSSVSDKYSFRTGAFSYDDGLPDTSEIANSTLSSPDPNTPIAAPPPFASLCFPHQETQDHSKPSVAETDSTPPPSFTPVEAATSRASNVEAETKAAIPRDTKGDLTSHSVEEKEPPPPYTEGLSPLSSFTYTMAAAGGAASIITQVPQGGPPAGTKFTFSRDELLTLPEFVLLSLFPNGLLPDGHMNSFYKGDTYPVDYDPASLQYMLDFFQTVV
ncbi:MAG: hypothetical protein Q9169_007395 [Polycauliona sp. 2 TL-2023]